MSHSCPLTSPGCSSCSSSRLARCSLSCRLLLHRDLPAVLSGQQLVEPREASQQLQSQNPHLQGTHTQHTQSTHSTASVTLSTLHRQEAQRAVVEREAKQKRSKKGIQKCETGGVTRSFSHCVRFVHCMRQQSHHVHLQDIQDTQLQPAWPFLVPNVRGSTAHKPSCASAGHTPRTAQRQSLSAVLLRRL
jgi:hypothetical protein